MTYLMLLLIVTYLIGNYNIKMLSLWLMLPYFISNFITYNLHYLQLSPDIEYYSILEIQCFVFIGCFCKAYKYMNSAFGKVSVYIASFSWFLIYFSSIIYIPIMTMFIFEYGEHIREEVVINLLFTAFIDNKKEENGEIRFWMMVCIYIIFKLAQYE